MKEERRIPELFQSRALVCIGLVFLSLVVVMNASIRGEQQFAFLAQSFLHGDLYLAGPALSNLADMTPHNGRYYWPPGPLPAVLLMPFELVAAFLAPSSIRATCNPSSLSRS